MAYSPLPWYTQQNKQQSEAEISRISAQPIETTGGLSPPSLLRRRVKSFPYAALPFDNLRQI